MGMFASRVVAVLRESCVDAAGSGGGGSGVVDMDMGMDMGMADKARLLVAGEVTAGLLGTLPDEGLREEVRVAFATELESQQRQ